MDQTETEQRDEIPFNLDNSESVSYWLNKINKPIKGIEGPNVNMPLSGRLDLTRLQIQQVADQLQTIKPKDFVEGIIKQAIDNQIEKDTP